MSDYQVGDEYTCKEDFFMEEESGGERSFIKGETYKVIADSDYTDDGPECSVWLMDDLNEEHGMDDALMERHFVRSKKTESPTEAYDRAMGIM